MSKYYKIIPIQHLLKNNRIALGGEVIAAGAFVNLQDSIDGKYCVECEAPKKSKKDTSKSGNDATQIVVSDKSKADAKAKADKAIEDAKIKSKADAKAKEEEATKAAQKLIDDKAIEDAKGNEGGEPVDLSKLDEKGLIKFAKENDFKLSKKDKKAGKDAIIASIVKQAK